jgi:hypothetical protein
MRSDNGGVAIALATLLSTYALKYFSLEPTMYGIFYSSFYSGIDSVINSVDFKTLNISDYISRWNIFVVIALYIVYCYAGSVINYIKKWFNRDINYITLDIYNMSDINTFIEYRDNFREFYSIADEVEFGNPELLVGSKEYNRTYEVSDMSYFKKSADDSVITFEDKNFDIKGYYMWKKVSVKFDVGKENVQKQINLPYIQLCIEKKGNADVTKYFDDLEKKCDEMQNDQIRLYHVKVIKDGSDEIHENEYLMYKGKKRPIEELEKKYINPFFHKERSRLWNMAKQIQHDPESFYEIGQTPRMGLLLWGPPGTGKSSFAFRIAMSLNRHIISVDLRSIKNKHEIYKIMRKPCVNGEYLNPKDVVFIFDEFDLTVLELYHKKNKMSNVISTWITHLNSEKNKLSTDKPDIKEDKVPIIDDEESESDKKTSKNYTIESFGYDTQDLSLEDLLEIFQGPVPLEGSIIISTTNKFKEILELCPALFRPGRLTPVYFGVTDLYNLNEVSKYFFNKEIDLEKYPDMESKLKTLEIPTSQIIDWAAASKFNYSNIDNNTTSIDSKWEEFIGNVINFKP